MSDPNRRSWQPALLRQICRPTEPVPNSDLLPTRMQLVVLPNAMLAADLCSWLDRHGINSHHEMNGRRGEWQVLVPRDIFPTAVKLANQWRHGYSDSQLRSRPASIFWRICAVSFSSAAVVIMLADVKWRANFRAAALIVACCFVAGWLIDRTQTNWTRYQRLQFGLTDLFLAITLISGILAIAR